MKLRHYSSNKLCIVDDDKELSIEFDLTDIYLNYGEQRLMVADHELFDLLKDFMAKHIDLEVE